MKYQVRTSQNIVFLLFLFMIGVKEVNAQNTKSSTESKVNAMVKKMTLEEKVGQMAQVQLNR